MEMRRPSEQNGTNSSHAVRLEHLREVAYSHGIESYTTKALLERPTSLPQYATSADHDEATRLLAEARRGGEKFKDPSKKLVNRFKSQAKRSSIDNAVNWDFTIDERASLLYQNIQSNGNVGLAQALLEYRGDNLLATVSRNNVATKVVKQITKGSSATSTSSFDQYDWLPIAVRNNSIQHVILLASRSQAKASLNRAFEVAISGNASAIILEELVRYGVNPNDHAEKIIPLLKSNRGDLVEVFLRSSIPLQPAQLNMALAQALDTKNMQIAAMLLAYGGDPNYAGARGFIDSVRRLDIPMILLLLANTVDAYKIRIEYLDHAMTILASTETSSENQQLVLLDALISAGGSVTSAGTEDELFKAVCSERLRVIQLLTSFGVIADHKNARCIRRALESGNTDIFETLMMMGRLTGGNLIDAVPHAMKLGRCERRFHVMQVLVGKGVNGPDLSQAVMIAMEEEDVKLFAELIKADAAVDGRTIEKAFRASDPAYLDLLCSNRFFNQATASYMMPIAMHPNTYHKVRSRMIAKASRKQLEVLSKALVDEIAVHNAREEIIAILLDSGASVDFSSGSALYQAVMAGRLKTVQQLTDVNPAHLSLHAAFRAAMSIADIPSRFTIMKLLLEKRCNQKIGQDDALCLEVKAAPSCGNHIVVLLLTHDASVDHQNGKAVMTAVNAASLSTLQLLLNAHPSMETLVAAFTQAMTLSSTTRLDSISMIAEEAMGSATALPVGLYLEQAITQNDLRLCKLLLHYGADPNVENGKAYIQAARLDDTAIFEELLVYRPNVQRLLPLLIRELNDEDKVITCLKLCFMRLQIVLNHSENVLLFLALDQFEEGESLVRFLIESGCSAGATRDLRLREDSENESVTPLIWALSRPLPGPSRKVLLAILDEEHEAKPDFTTPVTKTTAVLEAAKTGRHAVLARLVALGAKVNVKDSEERSALLLASEAGNVAIVTEILKARVRPNDGSLHAAARGAHEHIVGMLLDSGHSPNHIHAGRNALAELCLKGHPDGDDWEDRAYWVVDVLIKRGTNLSTTFSGKNLLHLALDNDMPTGIMKVLLQFSEFSENLNSESFLYEDANATVYSPSSYAEAFYAGPAGEKAKLVKTLIDKNCARNMWNRHGRHPVGYTYNSMPAHLKEMHDQIQRRHEQARIERELADRNHKHLMEQAAARHRQESLDTQQREAQQAAADMRRHEAEKRHRRELALAEVQSLKDKHQLEVNQQSALATQRQLIEDRDRARTLLQQQQMNALEVERAAAQSRFDEQQHTRQLQLLQKQDDSIRIRANEMRSVAQAAHAANTNVGLAGPSAMPPKQIGFRDDWATVD